ncbi:hypothetical protein Gotri_022234 [Gossypium trilobum]|uniref:Stigma-specific STIG1-like protein 4 n=1 Tax=Gossypium trilobum TaxID=34281 RepID=A0A7J9DFB1_9ROSI|nr:hypothetical protein [Gossypium trilobum]
MEWLAKTLFLPFLLQLLVLLPIAMAEANVKPKWVLQNETTVGASPWLRNAANPRPRPGGCMFRPWICEQGEHPPTARMRCCRNRCVDLNSDDAHCGLCALRCPFTWQCCRGVCINTNISPLNCGRCGNRCPFRVPCSFGMCGYAQPPPRPPRPFPPHPPRPFPPHPPRPIPPHPPRPFPPPHPHRPQPTPCPPTQPGPPPRTCPPGLPPPLTGDHSPSRS